MGYISKYMAFVVNIGNRKDNSRISYVSFGNVCSEIEFIEACSSKLGISLRRVVNLKIEL